MERSFLRRPFESLRRVGLGGNAVRLVDWHMALP